MISSAWAASASTTKNGLPAVFQWSSAASNPVRLGKLCDRRR
jgi:hypothetical protein